MTARRALWLFAPVAVFAAVVLHSAEISSLRGVFSSAEPPGLLAAAILAAAFAVNQGALYRGVFRLFGTETALGDAVVLSLVMAFASLALPAGTASGIAYFVTTARERGIPAARALLTGLGYYLFDYAALTPVLLLGMAVLRLHHDLGPGSLIAVGLFYLVSLGIAVLAVSGLLQPHLTARRIVASHGWLSRRLRWMGRLVSQRAAAAFGDEIQEVFTLVRARPERTLLPLLHAVVLQLISIALLAVVFASLDYRLAPPVLIAGYAVGAVFMVVSVTPAGAGVVEAGMTLALTSLGVPFEVAAAGTVLYRLYTFWLPMLAGFLTLRLLRPAHV